MLMNSLDGIHHCRLNITLQAILNNKGNKQMLDYADPYEGITEEESFNQEAYERGY